MTFERKDVDVAIIGAGPAGLSAAKVAAENGLSVTVIDEFPTPGGRMIGQFHEEPGNGWWIGKQVAAQLIEKNETLGVSFQCGQSVHGLEKTELGWKVLQSGKSVHTKYLLLATGAAEVPAPLPGWTLPGVMSIGAAQVMTNVHYVKPGERGLVIGVNVLAMAITRELAESGVELAGIVLPPTSPFARESAQPLTAFRLLTGLSHLSPTRMLRWGGQLVRRLGLANLAIHFFPRRGLQVWGIPLHLRTAAVSIHGSDKVESVTLVDLKTNGDPIRGTERDVSVDFVAIAGGLYPLAELASVAGCEFVHVPDLGGHIPIHSEDLRTLVQGLYVAGNITGVESAQVAMAQGQLAGSTICNDAGVWGSHGKERVLAAIEHVNHVRSSALIQFHPGIIEARRSFYRQFGQPVPQTVTS